MWQGRLAGPAMIEKRIPDLILLYLMMPGMDGFEVFAAVLGGGKSDGFGQEAFSHAGIPDEQDIFF